MESGDRDFRSLAQEIELRTGGISAAFQTMTDAHDLFQHRELVIFSSHALQRNLPHMLKLLEDVLARPTFNDLERLQLLLTQTAASLSNAVQESCENSANSAVMKVTN